MSMTRIGTANMYDRTINNISKQQSDLASQMEHASAGKRVIRASDDPVAAAQAERARTRMARYETGPAHAGCTGEFDLLRGVHPGVCR